MLRDGLTSETFRLVSETRGLYDEESDCVRRLAGQGVKTA
jgi:hypothetical protein